MTARILCTGECSTRFQTRVRSGYLAGRPDESILAPGPQLSRARYFQMTSSDAPPTSGFERRPGYPMSLRPADRRVRVEFAGATIVDAVRPMVMLEDGHAPVYYFERGDVRMDLLSRTARTTH